MNTFEYELNLIYRGAMASVRDNPTTKQLINAMAVCKNRTISLLHARGFDTGAKDGFEPPVPYPEPAPRPTTGPKPEDLEHTMERMQKVLTELGVNKTKAHSHAYELMYQVIKEIHK